MNSPQTPVRFSTHPRTAVFCLIVVFGMGIGAERLYRFWKTNTGEISIRRSNPEISVLVDGTPFPDLAGPLMLRAGRHEFIATWKSFTSTTSIQVKRGDRSIANLINFSVNDDQLRVTHKSHLLDAVPRPAAEQFIIQTPSRGSWYCDDQGGISVRPSTGAEAEKFTVHWLKPDFSEAFIQNNKGQYLSVAWKMIDTPPGGVSVVGTETPASVFSLRTMTNQSKWCLISSSQLFLDAESKEPQVRSTSYDVLATPHLLLKPGTPNEFLTEVQPPVCTDAADSSVGRLKGHTDVITSVTFTPDGRHVVSGSLDGTIRFWDVRTAKQIQIIGNLRPVTSLAISSDGKTLACGMAAGAVRVWTLEHGESLTYRDMRILSQAERSDRAKSDEPVSRNGGVLALAFSPDDSQLAAGGNYSEHSRIWKLSALDEKCRNSNIMGPITSLLWSRSGEEVLLRSDERQMTWWPEGKTRPRSSGLNGIVFLRSGNNPLIIAVDEVLDAETSEVVYKFTRQSYEVWAVTAQVCEKRNLLVTGDIIVNRNKDPEPDELVSIRHLVTGRSLSVLRDRFGQVGNLALSPDGDYLAYGCGCREVAYMRENSTGDYDVRLWKPVLDVIATADPLVETNPQKETHSN